LRIRDVTKTFSARSNTPASFSEVAAEFFIAPLISQFWSFLREEHTRILRSRDTPHSYKGSGTGMLLHPMTLSHFLRSLAIMMHAAQNSPAYLSVLAPEVLRVCLTMGSKPIQSSESDTEENNPASVISASLELAFVTLTGCQSLDGGRALCLEHATLIYGIRDWVEQVTSQLETGIRFPGAGGQLEGLLARNAFGVAKIVSELGSTWKGSMVDMF